MNTSEIKDWLVTQIGELLHVDPGTLDIHEPFASYGLTSLDLVTLSGDLEELLGCRLSPTLAYEYPNILALSHYLAENKNPPTLTAKETSSGFQSKEPIAIIGMGCRFPGAGDIDSFWQVLSDGIDTISEIPGDRWPKQAFYDPDPAAPGKANSKWGGFLDSVDQFDPFFFGISPNEAKHMDPQQRLLLELSYEALDNAGQSKEEIDGTRTGVFIGISVNEYSHVQFDNPHTITSHSGTGSALSIAANRISYFFNFRGPSMAIDTACSSSLAAVHLACQSLRNGECSMALAGGVNIILSPAHSIAFTKAGVLAPDGRCKTFDAGADGYVRGEGGGVIVLKPLSLAMADGDPVLAVIPGSAMVQDGRTNGLMAPSQASQEIMLREAYYAAGISPGSVQYVEAHGTGTLLGDSMEVAAIGAVIGAARTEGPCSIGSVKTNIGHLEAAAGIAGLIKVVLSIAHQSLPPSLHYHSPNPHIPFDTLNLQVQNQLEPWRSVSGRAIAGVSSFGFGGTNVHVVVCEATTYQKDEENEPVTSIPTPCLLLPLSANSHENLQSLAISFQNLLADEFDVTAKDICYAASNRRSQFNFRLTAIGNSRKELSNSLQALISDEHSPDLLSGHMVPDNQPRLVFVFSGQGGQWYGMGLELMKKEASFSKVIDRIDLAIREHFNWSLKEALLAEQPESRLDEIGVIQPAIFAIQVALAGLLQEWGIKPDAVIGHSMGEVAAAHVAGILSLEDAIRIVCLRSQLLKTLSSRGAMLATELSPVQAGDLLKGYDNDISIAAVNGPASTVLSGDPEKMQLIMASLERQNVFCRLVKADIASHSPQMDALRPELIRVLDVLLPQPAQIPMYSTVTGTRADNLVFDAGYWVDNLRKPVLFSDAIGRLLDSEYSILIEIGPHPLLLGSIQQSIQAHHHGVRLLPTLRREEPEQESLLKTLGVLYAEGFPIAWRNLYQSRGKHVQLPPVSWQRQRYWMDAVCTHSKNTGRRQQAENLFLHPLLGNRIDLANSPSTFVWQTEIDIEMLGFLGEHQIEGEIVLPAAAYIEMALQVAHETNLSRSHSLADLVFLRTMTLQREKARSVQTLLVPGKDGSFLFSIFSRTKPSDDWIQHASVTFVQLQEADNLIGSVKTTPEMFRQQHATELTAGKLYATLDQRGLQYGPVFRGIERLWYKDRESLGLIRLPASLQTDTGDYQYNVHPALLDACLQVLAAIPIQSQQQDLYMPSECRRVRLFSRPVGAIWSHVSMLQGPASGVDYIDADIRLFDEHNQLIAELTGFRLLRIGRQGPTRPSRQDTWLYHLHWQNRSHLKISPIPKNEKRRWLIFADDEGVGELFSKQLEADGDDCYLLPASDTANQDEGVLKEKIEQLLKKIPSPLYGIVHLWSLSIPPQSSIASGKMHILGCNSVLYLVQALASRFAGSPRLWLVTRGTQPVKPGERIAVAQSALWGFGKAISFELPELNCTRIDLDPLHPDSDSVQLLLKQVVMDDREDHIAFRGNDRFVLRLLPFTQNVAFRPTEMVLRADSTYLITGGWGGLGITTAKWMAERGARHLVLLGRGEPAPLAMRMIERMRTLGAEVVIAQADVSDQAQLKPVFEKMERDMPALRGVFHAAGLLDDGSLLNLDAQRMKHVMAPKVEGTWNLHDATRNLNLDFFVLFSSTVSVLGSPGQGNYAAASAYLDAMAHYRRHLGLPAVSINWGPWAEVGLAAAAKEKLQEQNASTRHLAKEIAIDQGLEMLELLLAGSSPQVAVLPFDLKNLLELYPVAAGMPFFTEVGGSDTLVGRHYARPNLRQKFVAPRNDVERKLAELWKQTLHIDRVGIHDSFFELGGDSVLAAQILALARKAYGISIKPRDAFQAFTIERLSELLAAEILRQIDDMSEEEAKARLSENN